MFKNDFFNNNDILDTLIPKDIYNKQIYCLNEDNDIYNFYPDIYKKIGKYVYINFLSKSEGNTVSISCLKKWNEAVLDFLNTQTKYTNESEQILKQVIQIVILDEIERNNYKISN